jgi:hypothetical protein
LVAVVELVSPDNKDRPENRKTFAIKCASYLQEQVSVMIVDIITDRQQNLYREIAQLFGLDDKLKPNEGSSYAVAFRVNKLNTRWVLDTWFELMSVGLALPVMPLWLTSDMAVPLNLEATYEETCSVLRIN